MRYDNHKGQLRPRPKRRSKMIVRKRVIAPYGRELPVRGVR